MKILSCKVYVPAKDFEESKRFYRELGFTMTPGWGGTADFELGAARFRLQDSYVEDWAGNFMFVIGVDDAQAWYEHARAVIKRGNYKTARVKPPEPVGDDLVTHVVDPAGVLLVLVARRVS